jgi:hypothetical protein
VSTEDSRLTSPTTDTVSLGAAAAGMAGAAKQRIRHVLELAAAESGLAAMSGVSMLVMAIVAAALIIVAWMLLVSVVAYVLVLVGVSWVAAGLALAVIHLAVAYYLYRKALKLSRDLTLPSLRRALFTPEE